jgi:hypothetical protein
VCYPPLLATRAANTDKGAKAATAARSVAFSLVVSCHRQQIVATRRTPDFDSVAGLRVDLGDVDVVCVKGKGVGWIGLVPRLGVGVSGHDGSHCAIIAFRIFALLPLDS